MTERFFYIECKIGATVTKAAAKNGIKSPGKPDKTQEFFEQVHLVC